MKKLTTLLLVAFVQSTVPAVTAQTRDVNKDLEDMAAAERAFSAAAVKDGFRDSFIKFFADDGIGFGPHPERTKEKLSKTQPPTGPRRVIFNWAPMFGDISAAGDMGYTTGPVLFTDVTANPKPPWHGIYFSVWQKQADASWRVAIDMGVDTPEAVAPIDKDFTAAKGSGWPAKENTKTEGFELLDKQFSDSIAKTGPIKAYRARLGDQFRIHRKGIMPVVERAALDGLATWPVRFKFIGGKIAKSNDLAFTYGKYTAADSKNNSEQGYYVHVWRRDEAGKWRLVIDVQNPLPKENK